MRCSLRKTPEKLLWVAIAAILVGFSIQLFSPLRIDGDSVIYLGMAESFVTGNGLLFKGGETRYPPGFPLMVATLDFLGIASSSILILLNIIFMLAGLLSAWYLLRYLYGLSSELSSLICILTLLSFNFIKQITLPATDMIYFGLSMLCLYMCSAGETQTGAKRVLLYSLAGIIGVFAFNVRMVGIVLAPALLFTYLKPFLVRQRDGSVRKSIAMKWVVIVISLLVLLSGLTVVSQTIYVNEAWVRYNREVKFILLGQRRLCELGSIAMNIPISRTPIFLHSILEVLGGMVFIMILWRFWSIRKRPNVGDIYLFSYLGVLSVWPYSDTRFWLPVMPLMAATVVQFLRSVGHWCLIKRILLVYATLFCLIGVGALGYSSWISLGGSDFPERYGNNRTRQTYRAAFGSRMPIDWDQVDWDKVHLLRRYECRASNKRAVR